MPSSRRKKNTSQVLLKAIRLPRSSPRSSCDVRERETIRTEVMTRTRSFHNHHHLFFLILLIHSLMFKVRWQDGRLLTQMTGHVEAYSINHHCIRHTLRRFSFTSTVSATCGSRSSMRIPVLAITVDQRQTASQFSTLKSSLSSSSLLSTSINHESSPTIIPVPVMPLGIPRKFVAYPFQYHQELTIRIDSLTNMGWGIGRVPLDADVQSLPTQQQGDSEESIVMTDDGMGGTGPGNEQSPERSWVIMVPHVVVGELCVVRIFRNQKQYSEADLVTVVEPSPDRVIPKCSLAGLCGGCQYQHMSIQAQRAWKTKHVEEVLMQQKIEGYTPTSSSSGQEKEGQIAASFNVLPTLGTDQVYNYRSKITPHYDAPRLAVGEAGDLVGDIDVDDATYATTATFVFDAIGFQQSSNRNLVDVLECPIATAAINEKYRQVRTELHAKAQDGSLAPAKKNKKKRRGSSRSSGMLGATLLFRQADDDAETGDSIVITDHNQYMRTTVKGITFQYLAGNFFQNNNYVLPLMVDAVIEAATQPTTATGDRPTHLIDCYCGSGLFALSAASHFELCVGIEVNEKAIGEATYNAEMNTISNCQFMAASAEAIFTSPPTITLPGFEHQRVQDFPRDKTVVVLDPPRKGCSEEFLEQLYEYGPKRIVYMSCGPSTQARDAKGIVEVGGYEIISTQPFDLFPQTKHIECLMIFEKR